MQKVWFQHVRKMRRKIKFSCNYSDTRLTVLLHSNRLFVEYESYIKEEVNDKAKLDLYVQEGRGQHDLKQVKQVHEETVAMITNTRGRLQQAIKDLQKFIDQYITEDDKKLGELKDGEKPSNLAQTVEYTDAITLLEKLDAAKLVPKKE